jgi:hypothetical protein
VPDPIEREPGPAFGPSGQLPRPAPSNSAPFGSDGSQGTFGKGAQIIIPQRTEIAQSVGTVDPQTFENPVEGTRHDREGLVTVSAKAAPSGTIIKGSDPCAYDRTSYSWLRGFVDYDTRDKSWHIIYSQHPDRHDRYGGAIRLVDHPKLATLRSGDVVYVEGRIDEDHLDARRKPQYRIKGDHIEPLPVGAATQSMGN